MGIEHIIELSADERATLEKSLKKGKHSARRLTRARILLLGDQGKRTGEIAAALQTSASTVKRTRRRFVEGGLEHALSERPRPGAERKLDGRQEARLVALACSTPPDGRKAWTMQLLADRFIELGEVDFISDETVRRVLKKTT